MKIKQNKQRRLTVFVAVVAVLGLALPGAGWAQQRPDLPEPAEPGVMTNPDVNDPIQFDISPPLRDLPVHFWPPSGVRDVPILPPKSPLASRVTRPQVDEALQTYVGPLVSATIGVHVQGIGNGAILNCPSVSGFTVAPPDANLAVGDTQVVQWVNLCFAVFNKATGAVIAGPFAGNHFWTGFGGPCEATNNGDPIIQWDKRAHRWVAFQNVFGPFLTCIAISKTADATGSYFRYSFSQPGFPDYQKVGIMPEAYYQTQNDFGSGFAFAGVNVCAYQRPVMLVGGKAKQICFLDNSGGTLFDDSMLPADLDSPSNPPPTGQPEVLLGSIDNFNPGSHVYMYLFKPNFAFPKMSTFKGTNGSLPIAVSSYSLACGGFANCVPQSGVPDRLEVLGDRLLYRLAYRNVGTNHQAWVVTHAVNTSSGKVGQRWYEFRSPESSTTMTVFQSGTFAGPPLDTQDRWMGSIAMDKVGDIILGYSESSSSMFPSIFYTGRVPTDPPGTLQTEARILAGTGSQTDTFSRWGDYTSMALDAADDCTFWYTNEFYTTDSSFNWRTQITSLKFPSCK